MCISHGRKGSVARVAKWKRLTASESNCAVQYFIFYTFFFQLLFTDLTLHFVQYYNVWPEKLV